MASAGRQQRQIIANDAVFILQLQQIEFVFWHIEFIIFIIVTSVVCVSLGRRLIGSTSIRQVLDLIAQ